MDLCSNKTTGSSNKTTGASNKTTGSSKKTTGYSLTKSKKGCIVESAARSRV